MMNVSGKIYKLERNAIWLLLFHHNLTKGDFFYTKEEGKKTFNSTYGKYSILYTLNNAYRIKRNISRNIPQKLIKLINIQDDFKS